MLKLFRNRRGVALMLVLSAVAMLTSMGIEFAYNTSIYYDLAQNEADRLKAFYLAKSAYNFMRLELKFDRMFRQIVQSQNLGQYLGENAQLPLCQQFPLSTGLIRAVFLEGKLPGGLGGEGAAEGAAPAAGETPPPEGEGAPAGEAIEEARKDSSLSQEQGAKDFLQFDGDFDGECIDEGTKINLNGFYGLAKTPGVEGTTSAFDQYGQFLFRFFSQPRIKPLFEEADVRISDIIASIGDWIDIGVEGGAGGAGAAVYQRDGASYPARTGKLVTLLSAYLIEGVVDEWFEPTIDSFTIYGDGTVNVCTASPDIVESLIRRYVDATPNLPPLRLEDPEEMARLTKAVTDACAGGQQGDALKQAVSQALSQAIGSVTGEAGAAATPAAGTMPAAAAGAGAAAAAANTGFAAYMRTEPRFFTLKLAGQVADATVRVRAVLDVKETDPKRWKLLYWKVY
jgi:general secretion pathway protein K